MSIPAIRTAVIPAAGFGTRFLPASKAVPKEMIPLVDRPVIEYVVREAVDAGLDRICIILSKGKDAVISHFSPDPELELGLEKHGKTALLEEVRALSRLAEISFVWQRELKGLGDAVLCAKEFVGDEPFAVLLGDTVLKSDSQRSVTGQLVDVFRRTGAPVVASEHVPQERISSYGIIGGTPLPENGKVIKISSLVEKPVPEEAPGDLAIASRYLFTPDIFEELAVTKPGKNNEIQLTDAMRSLLKKREMFARVIDGRRYDIGSKLGFLKATVEFGLAREEFADSFREFLTSFLLK